MKKDEYVTQQLETVSKIEITTRRVLFNGGMLFSLASFASIAFLFYELFTAEIDKKERRYTNTFDLVSSHSVELLILAVLLISSILAFLCFKGAGSINKNVIPDPDRKLLSELIQKDDTPIDQYIRLSSLSGTTGFFTKLGLTGLPLATIGLTILFTLLYMITKSTELFDLAKLTLGAFLGSYVQKPNNTATTKKNTKEGSQDVTVSSMENPYTESGPVL